MKYFYFVSYMATVGDGKTVQFQNLQVSLNFKLDNMDAIDQLQKSLTQQMNVDQLRILGFSLFKEQRA